MFCTQCGAKLQDGFLFCSQCGHKIERIEADVPENKVMNEPKAEDLTVTAVDVEETVETAEEASCESNIEEVLEEEKIEETVENTVDSNSEVSEETTESSEEMADEISEKQDVVEEVADISETGSATEETNEEVQIEPETEAQPKPKKKRRVGAHIAASFVSVILALSLILTMVLAMAKIVLGSNVVSNTLADMDIKDIKVEDIIDEGIIEDAGLVYESDELLDFIYDNIDQENLDDELTEDEFKDIIDSDAFAEYIGEIIEKNIKSILKGKKTDLITIDNVCDFLRDEDDEIEEIIGYEITDERIENLRNNLNNEFSDIFSSVQDISLKQIAGKGAENAIVFMLEDYMIIALVVVDLLLIALLMLIMRVVPSGLRYCGVTSVIVGVIFTTVVMLLNFGIVDSLGLIDIVSELITNAVSYMFVPLLILSVAPLLLGIGFIVAAAIIRVIQKHKITE